jgi:hypothetical protein
VLDETDDSRRDLMSALVELTADLGEIAKRLDLTSGAGRAELQRVYIDPTLKRIDAAAGRAFGSDRRPFKNKAYQVTVDAKVTATATGCEVVFRLGPKGFWVFGQYGAGPHDIRPRRPGGRLASRSHPHPTRGPVHHPGSTGRRAISGAWRAIRSSQHEAIAAVIDKQVARG